MLLNGYGEYDFARQDLGVIGSYGGRTYSNQPIDQIPIVFVHGNSDGALLDPQNTKWGTGWSSSIKYFTKQNYSSATLYATTWGDRITGNAYQRTHSCEVITRIRTFIEAVLDYTGAPQVHIISHSMGVAIARKAVRGGYIDADDGICNVGTSLRSRINTFIGISGANYGMCQCSGGNTTAIFPTCNKKNGFWPGEPCGIGDSLTAQELCGGPIRACSRNAYSQLLQEMNENPINEGSFVFSFWSYNDDLIGFNDSVYGRPTSFVPFSNATRVLRGMTHMETKDKTQEIQYKLIKTHKF
uniref:Lipase n=1 Tax=Panagrolaimus sp. PS1159 TaxID=55785 RepID=A0AC35EZ02_9BILA